MLIHENEDERGLLTALSLEDKVRLLTGADNWHTHGSELIGLRPVAYSDGPAGVRGVAMDERNPSASLPCPSALGATWDPELVQDVACALGQEARSKGIGVLLGPTINMMRTPLGGRGFECFAEDPVLAARMAVAFVRGVQAAGVAATLKHFAANDSETGRWTCDVRVAERVLREVYLLPFEACVREADAALVMPGYNKVNGVSMTEHGALLNGTLKREWGFAGVAVSDWNAGRSTVATAAAGLDLLMPGPDSAWGEKLVAAVAAGEISAADVDDKVIRVLRLARRVGALSPSWGDDPPGDPPEAGGSPSPQAPLAPGPPGPLAPGPPGAPLRPVLADARLLQRAAAAAFTLLRNERQVLPLNPQDMRTVALIGPNALFPVTQGGGSARVAPARATTTPAAALRTALAGTGTELTVHQGCMTWHNVPEPPAETLRDPVSGEQGTRLEFRAEDGSTLASEHRGATMFTWWDGLPRGVGGGARGTIVLRARYRAPEAGRYLLGAGGVGDVTLTADGEIIAAGTTPMPEDPVEAMVRPGEIRSALDLAGGQEVTLQVVLIPANWATPPVSIRLGIAPAANEDAMLDEAVAAASAADVAVLVVGSGAATESEGFDRTSLSLPGRQDELVSRVAAVCDRSVVVVNAGMPMLMPWADQVGAIGYAWLPGQAMGDALADVLLGNAEPGGRLPVTIPRAEADCPVLHAIPAADGTLAYEEGLLIGYRGYDRAGTDPLFPFGHGLGYTSWAYEAATADCAELPADGDLTVTVTVRNTGTRAGREVVQGYLEPPDDDPANPARTLVAFAAVTAAPGERAAARLTVPRRAFARYDEAAGDWVWLSGDYRLCVGGSSRDLPLEVVVRSMA